MSVKTMKELDLLDDVPYGLVKDLDDDEGFEVEEIGKDVNNPKPYMCYCTFYWKIYGDKYEKYVEYNSSSTFAMCLSNLSCEDEDDSDDDEEDNEEDDKEKEEEE